MLAAADPVRLAQPQQPTNTRAFPARAQNCANLPGCQSVHARRDLLPPASKDCWGDWDLHAHHTAATHTQFAPGSDRRKTVPAYFQKWLLPKTTPDSTRAVADGAPRNRLREPPPQAGRS